MMVAMGKDKANDRRVDNTIDVTIPRRRCLILRSCELKNKSVFRPAGEILLVPFNDLLVEIDTVFQSPQKIHAEKTVVRHRHTLMIDNAGM